MAQQVRLTKKVWKPEINLRIYVKVEEEQEGGGACL